MRGYLQTDVPTRFTVRALSDVAAERMAQNAKWGPQHHLDGTSTIRYHILRDEAIAQCDWESSWFLDGSTWRSILKEETFEAFAEEDQVKLRAELVQAAAVAVAWIEDIDSRETT